MLSFPIPIARFFELGIGCQIRKTVDSLSQNLDIRLKSSLSLLAGLTAVPPDSLAVVSRQR